MRPIEVLENENKNLEDFKELFNKKCDTKYISSSLPSVKRIIVFGDIHGDYNLALLFLLTSGVIKINNTNTNKNKNKIEWIGGKTVIVQVGDQIDRCRPRKSEITGELLLCDNSETMGDDDDDADEDVLELYEHVHNLAVKHGGAVYSLLGNHELMNSLGNVSYASYKELLKSSLPNSVNKIESGKNERKRLFAPGNKYGNFLGCNRFPFLIIGSNIFVHAGMVDGLLEELELKKNDLEIISRSIRLWLWNQLKNPEQIKKIIQGSQFSPFWTRLLGSIERGVKMSDKRCSDNIKNVLELFNVDRIIVGHTPKIDEGITGTCYEEKNDTYRVWDVDIAVSKAFDKVTKYKRKLQFLVIDDDTKFSICDMNGCREEVRPNNLNYKDKDKDKDKFNFNFDQKISDEEMKEIKQYIKNL